MKRNYVTEGLAVYHKYGYASIPLLQKHLKIGAVLARKVQKLVIQKLQEELK